MTVRTPERSAERILVRCPNWLGDVVMSTPGLRALRRAKPEAWIVGQLPPALVPVLEGNESLDELWPVSSRSAGWTALRHEARRVAEFAFDRGIVIPESISSALRMRWGRVPRTIGYARDPLRRRLLSEVVPTPREWGPKRLVSRERFVAGLMDAVGAPAEDLRLDLVVTKDEETRLDLVLEGQGLGRCELENDPPIVLAPGASFGDSKRWPLEYYAELADRFANRDRLVILLGGPGEGAILAAIATRMKSRSVLLDGSLDLGALKALLRLARILIANDAGARHVAAAFGVPSVIFFGPTSLEKTANNLDRIEILERSHDCRPCYLRACPIDHRCLRTISVDDAEAAAFRALRLAEQAPALARRPGRTGGVFR